MKSAINFDEFVRSRIHQVFGVLYLVFYLGEKIRIINVFLRVLCALCGVRSIFLGANLSVRRICCKDLFQGEQLF